MTPSDLFLWPEALPAALLVPIVAWLWLHALDRSRARRLGSVVGPRSPTVATDLRVRQRRARRWLFASGLSLALIAVAQPAWGVDVRKVQQRGVDLVVCLDVSRSMLARDLPPSRLEHARTEIRRLAEHVHGDRLALVAFAGEARLTVPLTRDTDTFADLVDQCDPLSVGRGGTDLGAALETALDALQGQTGEHEVVLLITDGEDHAERGLRVARTCGERNVTVHCVGIGSTFGSKIAVRDAAGTESFVKDRAGDEVVSTMDPATLRRIAEATGGGAFVDASTEPRPLVQVYEQHVRTMQHKSFASDQQRGRRHRFQWPLSLAFLLLALELCLTDRARSRG